MFKKLASELALPLSLLLTSSFLSRCCSNIWLSISQLPAEWKTGTVTRQPDLQSGIACDVSNCMPVSLTCIACNVMERIIVQRMLIYLKVNNIIIWQQHGFLPRRSTTNNLLDSLNDWTLAINNKQFQNCCIYGKCVFSILRNKGNVGDDVMSSGRPFCAWAAATLNSPLPIVDSLNDGWFVCCCSTAHQHYLGY